MGYQPETPFSQRFATRGGAQFTTRASTFQAHAESRLVPEFRVMAMQRPATPHERIAAGAALSLCHRDGPAVFDE